MTNVAGVRDRYRTLRELAQEAIFNDIMAGRLKPGEKLIETDLVSRYKISRGPIREAMRALEGQGLLKATSNRGCVVTTLTRSEIVENYEMRIELEGLAARLATPLLSAADFDHLESVLRTMSAGGTPPDEWMGNNQEFHLSIYAASGRSRLLSLIRELMEAVHPYIKVFVTNPDRLRDTNADHGPLLAALKAGDAIEAERITQEHLRRAAQIIATFVPGEEGTLHMELQGS